MLDFGFLLLQTGNWLKNERMLLEQQGRKWHTWWMQWTAAMQISPLFMERTQWLWHSWTPTTTTTDVGFFNAHSVLFETTHCFYLLSSLSRNTRMSFLGLTVLSRIKYHIKAPPPSKTEKNIKLWMCIPFIINIISTQSNIYVYILIKTK